MACDSFMDLVAVGSLALGFISLGYLFYLSQVHAVMLDPVILRRDLASQDSEQLSLDLEFNDETKVKRSNEIAEKHS